MRAAPGLLPKRFWQVRAWPSYRRRPGVPVQVSAGRGPSVFRYERPRRVDFFGFTHYWGSDAQGERGGEAQERQGPSTDR